MQWSRRSASSVLYCLSGTWTPLQPDPWLLRDLEIGQIHLGHLGLFMSFTPVNTISLVPMALISRALATAFRNAYPMARAKWAWGDGAKGIYNHIRPELSKTNACDHQMKRKSWMYSHPFTSPRTMPSTLCFLCQFINIISMRNFSPAPNTRSTHGYPEISVGFN